MLEGKFLSNTRSGNEAAVDYGKLFVSVCVTLV